MTLSDALVPLLLLAGIVVILILLAVRRFRRRPHTARVVYKNGAVIDVRCKTFVVHTDALGGVREVKWSNAWPNPLHFGVDEVAAVWQVR